MHVSPLAARFPYPILGRLREDWRAIRAGNRRLCDAEAQDAMPGPDVATFRRVTRPSKTKDGLYAPGLRFARVVAVLAGPVGFCNLIEGFTNRQLAMRTRQFLGGPYTSRQATYDLRRLKRKGLIRRLRKRNRYALTPMGRAVAVLFTKTYGRVLSPGLALFDPNLSDDLARRSPLAVAWRALTRALDDFAATGLVAA